jgi:hypothetical protein
VQNLSAVSFTSTDSKRGKLFDADFNPGAKRAHRCWPGGGTGAIIGSAVGHAAVGALTGVR